MSQISLSVLVPVYNEQFLVAESLRRLRILAKSPDLSRVEVIVVNDGSQDGTAEVLRAFEAECRDQPSENESWTFLHHARNSGKGKAIQTGLAHATCDISVIHDADLEYNPADLVRIARAFLETEADAVFGSRFAGGKIRRVLMYRHELGNRLLTFLCNVVTNLNLTDMETCYKAIRTDLFKSIPLVSNDFRIEPELTIKLAKREVRLFEIPISYSGRTYTEGKKIGWRDGVLAVLAIGRFAISDQIYKEDEFGSQILARLSRAPRFNAWMADMIRPFCGAHVLEIGGGVGNLTRQLLPRSAFVVSDINPLYLRRLVSLQEDRPYLAVHYCDVTEPSSFPVITGGYDTVVCLNVIEHVADDRRALANILEVLAPGGRAVILVPQGQGNFGTLDEALGHMRRYSPTTLMKVAQDAGFTVVRVLPFNRIGSVAWYINGKLLKRRTFPLPQIKLLNLLTPVFRLADAWLPVPPLSLIAVLERPAQPAEHPRAMPSSLN